MPFPTNDNPTGAAKPPAHQLPEGGFLSTLQTMRKGATITDLEINLKKLVEAVRDQHKPGTMTWKVVVSPNSKGNVEILAIDDEVTLKLPKAEGGTTIYYADDQNRLMRNDPKQMEMPALAEVPKEAEAPIRQVAHS